MKQQQISALRDTFYNWNITTALNKRHWEMQLEGNFICVHCVLLNFPEIILKYMKRYTPSLIIRKIKIKITLRCHFLLNWQNSKSLKYIVTETLGKQAFSYISGGIYKGTTSKEGLLAVFTQIHKYSPSNSIFINESHWYICVCSLYIYKFTYAWFFITSLFIIVKDWIKSMYSAIGDRLNKP